MAAKRRVGDWECGTIVGVGQKPALVSVVERKTRYLVLKKAPRKTAALDTAPVVGQLKPLKALAHTLTMDNGMEFAAHEQVAATLSVDTCFEHAYASWDRGLQEQVNGLVRQHYAKSCRFDTITGDEVEWVMDQLNNRPRKLLGFRTPREAMLESARPMGVALRI